MSDALPKELQGLLDALPVLTPIQKTTAIRALGQMNQKALRIQDRVVKAAETAEQAAKAKRTEADTASKFVQQVTDVMAQVATDVVKTFPQTGAIPKWAARR
jgi:CHASE3 domain sensor protein